MTTTLTRTEWVEVLFARTDVVSRAACALELKFAANNALELVQSMLRQVLFPEETLASALAINAWLCALALACQMTKCAALDTTQHGSTKSDVLTRAMKVMWQGGEVTVHRDQLGEKFLHHFSKEHGHESVAAGFLLLGKKMNDTARNCVWTKTKCL